MSRVPLIGLAFGLVALAGVAALGITGAAAVLPSYLAGWLVLLAVPLGALALVMGAEVAGLAEAPVLPVLRRLVALMPLAAMLALPILINRARLYPAPGLDKDAFSTWWMTPTSCLVRMAVSLLLWVALAFVFARSPFPGRGRSAWAGAGLAAHVVLGTLAATDWITALEPAFTSSASGLTLIAAQTGLALALAILLGGGIGCRPPETRALALGLVVLLAVWGFFQCSQFLVVWSANLPREALWYLHRSAGFGQVAQAAAALLCAAVLMALLPRGLAGRAGVLVGAAAAVAGLHAAEMLWLVTPSFRGEFRLTPADLLAVAGTAGLSLGTVMLLDDRPLDRARAGHDAA